MNGRVISRNAAKWGATIIACAITAAWIGSAWRHVDYIAPSGHYVAVSIGRVAVGWADPAMGITRGFRLSDGRNKWPSFDYTRFDWRFNAWGDPMQWGVQVPGWVPVLAAGFGAAWLWRRDATMTSREQVGLCAKCGYSMAGLPHGTPCPECGDVNTAAPCTILVRGDGLDRR